MTTAISSPLSLEEQLYAQQLQTQPTSLTDEEDLSVKHVHNPVGLFVTFLVLVLGIYSLIQFAYYASYSSRSNWSTPGIFLIFLLQLGTWITQFLPCLLSPRIFRYMFEKGGKGGLVFMIQTILYSGVICFLKFRRMPPEMPWEQTMLDWSYLVGSILLAVLQILSLLTPEEKGATAKLVQKKAIQAWLHPLVHPWSTVSDEDLETKDLWCNRRSMVTMIFIELLCLWGIHGTVGWFGSTTRVLDAKLNIPVEVSLTPNWLAWSITLLFTILALIVPLLLSRPSLSLGYTGMIMGILFVFLVGLNYSLISFWYWTCYVPLMDPEYQTVPSWLLVTACALFLLLGFNQLTMGQSSSNSLKRMFVPFQQQGLKEAPAMPTPKQAQYEDATHKHYCMRLGYCVTFGTLMVLAICGIMAMMTEIGSVVNLILTLFKQLIYSFSVKRSDMSHMDNQDRLSNARKLKALKPLKSILGMIQARVGITGLAMITSLVTMISVFSCDANNFASLERECWLLSFVYLGTAVLGAGWIIWKYAGSTLIYADHLVNVALVYTVLAMILGLLCTCAYWVPSLKTVCLPFRIVPLSAQVPMFNRRFTLTWSILLMQSMVPLFFIAPYLIGIKYEELAGLIANFIIEGFQFVFKEMKDIMAGSGELKSNPKFKSMIQIMSQAIDFASLFTDNWAMAVKREDSDALRQAQMIAGLVQLGYPMLFLLLVLIPAVNYKTPIIPFMLYNTLAVLGVYFRHRVYALLIPQLVTVAVHIAQAKTTHLIGNHLTAITQLLTIFDTVIAIVYFIYSTSFFGVRENGKMKRGFVPYHLDIDWDPTKSTTENQAEEADADLLVDLEAARDAAIVEDAGFAVERQQLILRVNPNDTTDPDL